MGKRMKKICISLIYLFVRFPERLSNPRTLKNGTVFLEAIYIQSLIFIFYYNLILIEYFLCSKYYAQHTHPVPSSYLYNAI